jgi:hypothetical protein
MFISYEDPIVKEKHLIQKKILEKANGDLSSYNRIVRDEALKIRNQIKKRLKKVAVRKDKEPVRNSV